MTRHLSTSGLKANPQSKFSLVHCALCVAMAGFLTAFMDDEEDLAMEEESGSCMPTAEMAPVPSSNDAAASTNNAASTLPGNKKVHPSSAGCNTHPVSVPAIRRALKPEGPHAAPDKVRGKDKTQRAPRGSKGTFAGRRPPADKDKLQIYNKLKDEYHSIQKALSQRTNQSKKKVSLSQEMYWRHMQKSMAEATGTGAERFTSASKSFREKCGVN